MQETDRQDNFELLNRDEVLSVESAEISQYLNLPPTLRITEFVDAIAQQLLSHEEAHLFSKGMSCEVLKFGELICNNTFKVVELLKAMQKSTGQSDAWFYKGVECEVLGLTQGWQKGKVRISIEFCPDEPELTDSSKENAEASSQPESPLDDIRRTIVD
jgi:hypothetical protein